MHGSSRHVRFFDFRHVAQLFIQQEIWHGCKADNGRSAGFSMYQKEIGKGTRHTKENATFYAKMLHKKTKENKI